MRSARIGFASVALAVMLLGCASTEELAAKDDALCASIGMAADHPRYGDCRLEAARIRQNEEALRLQRIGMALSNAGQSMGSSQRTPLIPLRNRSAEPVTTACMKTGETASGMNKICYYSCAGSQAATTVSAVSLCPLTLRR